MGLSPHATRGGLYMGGRGGGGGGGGGGVLIFGGLQYSSSQNIWRTNN